MLAFVPSYVFDTHVFIPMDEPGPFPWKLDLLPTLFRTMPSSEKVFSRTWPLGFFDIELEFSVLKLARLGAANLGL